MHSGHSALSPSVWLGFYLALNQNCVKPAVPKSGFFHSQVWANPQERGAAGRQPWAGVLVVLWSSRAPSGTADLKSNRKMNAFYLRASKILNTQLLCSFSVLPADFSMCFPTWWDAVNWINASVVLSNQQYSELTWGSVKLLSHLCGSLNTHSTTKMLMENESELLPEQRNTVWSSGLES